MRTPIHLRLHTLRAHALLVLLAACLAPATATHAADCGSIISFEFGEQVTEPIEDCDNPFGSINTNPDLQVFFEEQLLVDGEVYPFSGQEGTFSLEGISPEAFESEVAIYRHNGDDYQVEYLFSGPQYTFTATGTYSVVVTEVGMPVFGAYPWSQLFAHLIPTAHAFAGFRTQITIEVIEAVDLEPAGASSVLFLPGIQASRLYAGENIEVSGFRNDIEQGDRLWETVSNNEIAALAMTESGETVNQIYTKDVIEEVTGSTLGANIYKSFLDLLQELKDDGVIVEYVPLAYDWRRSVFDVATKPVQYEDETKRLKDELLRLAENSHTEKVTIITHSNGGWVAKALLETYGDAELAGKVDKLVMIGTPQLGTPEGLLALLHGRVLNGIADFITSDSIIRDVIRNMPGTYTLLPSERYFSEVAEQPLVTSDDSNVTAPIRAYGDISNPTELEAFLLDTEDTFSNDPGINEPQSLNPALFSSANSERFLLDNWQAPEGVEVYEVVGTGLPTLTGIDYHRFACVAVFCANNEIIKPSLLFSNDGDATVVAGSAQGYDGDKTTAVINLQEASEFLRVNRNHANLTETSAIQTFVQSVIEYPYTADAVTIPEFTEVSTRYTIVSTHSPVQPRIVTNDGRVVGFVDETLHTDIIGSQYIELAGSVYLIVPQDEADFTIEVSGTDTGVFTLQIEELSVKNEQIKVANIVASTTDMMTATMEVTDGDLSNLELDFNGDGIIDEERTLNGELINRESELTGYELLSATIKSLELRKFQERFLLRLVEKAERFGAKDRRVFQRLEKRMLRLVKRMVRIYERRGIISSEQRQDINKVLVEIK